MDARRSLVIFYVRHAPRYAPRDGKSATACARRNWVRGKSIKYRNDLRYMSTYIRALACHLRFF